MLTKTLRIFIFVYCSVRFEKEELKGKIGLRKGAGEPP